MVSICLFDKLLYNPVKNYGPDGTLCYGTSTQNWDLVRRKQSGQRNGKSVTIEDLGLVLQNFVSLTLSLSPQFVNYVSISKASTMLFFQQKITVYL